MYVCAIHAYVYCDMNPFPTLFSYIWLRDNGLTSSGAVFCTPESIILALVYSQSKNGVLLVQIGCTPKQRGKRSKPALEPGR